MAQLSWLDSTRLLQRMQPMQFLRRPFSLGALVAAWALGLAVGASPAAAQQLFRIGTGNATGTYHPVGLALAAGLSEPGVLVVQAQGTSGSIANVNAVAAGQLESAFSQADIATWHYSGTGIVKPQFKLDALRLVATLYPESVHVVVRKSLGVTQIGQLKGLRVALDEPGSGVLVNARQILRAYGLTERDIKPAYIKGPQAAQRLAEGSLDALFFVGGVPSEFMRTLAAGTDVMLLPIEGAAADALRQGGGFFTPSIIGADAYRGTAAVSTLAVGALWVAHQDASTELIYQLTKRLYSAPVLARVRTSHPAAAQLAPETGVQGAGLPRHPGAERFYREIGVLK